VLISTRRATALGILVAASMASHGCGGSKALPPADALPATDAGGVDAGASDAAGDDSAVDTGTVVPPPNTTCAAPPAVVTAPADTSTPAPATGPYLWRNVNITAGGFVSGIVYNPAQRDVVYARTDIGGAYRWNAVAKKWIPLLDWIPRVNTNWTGVESIAVDPTDANKVYVAGGTYVTSGTGAIFRSGDQGRTFATTTTTIPMGGNGDGRSVGERLVVDPIHPSTLYFGTRTMGLWKSTDSAVTWDRVTSFPGAATTPNGVGVAFVVMDPTSCGPTGQTVAYVALGAPGTSIYRTSDGGATWAAVPGQPTTLLPSHGAVSTTGKLYVTYGGGTGANGDGPNSVLTGAVYKLDVATGAWADITPSIPASVVTFGYSGVTIDGSQPDTVAVCTLDRWTIGDEIFRSTDAGASWKPLNVAHAAHDISAAPWVTFHDAQPNYTGWMADVEIDPFNPARVLHVTGQGIWATDDMTAVDSSLPTHWDFRSAGIEETSVLDLASPPAGAPLLSAVGDIGGFRHDDLEASPAGGMYDNPVLTSTDTLDFAELAPNVVARVGRINVTTNDVTTSTPTGALSLDGGSTWTQFATSPPVASGSGGTIAVSADGATLIWDLPANTRAGVAGGPQVSRDRGATWTPSTGIGAIRPVFADRVNPSKFYAFDGANARFYVSVDGGASFALSAATGLPRGTAGHPRATPGVEGDIWLVTAMGLRHSINSGAAFTPITSDMPATATVALGLGKAAPGASYPAALYLIGTVANLVGVYRSDDAGVTWTRIDDDQHRWATAVSLVGDARTYGRVYIATNGRGILYGDIAPAN
jgi:hypothetical protein